LTKAWRRGWRIDGFFNAYREPFLGPPRCFSEFTFTGANTMSDIRQRIPSQPAAKSSSPLAFIVGGLVVAVAVIAYLFANDAAPISNDAPAVSIENNTTTTVPTAEPAPATAAEPAPAEAAPAPAAPATQP
jgi:hypothetical protein